MRVSFENVNKGLLLFALASLIYRKGSFYNSFIPKPFEALIALVLFLTIIYLIKEKKITEFFRSFPRRILIALCVLVGSIFVGWIVGALTTDIQTTLNSVLEFGTFAIGIVACGLVLFYTNHDEKTAKWYLYALLLPNFFMVAYFLSYGVTGYFGMPNNNILEATLNPNVLSKVLLIPTLFFMGASLFALTGRRWLLVLQHGLLASICVALVIWTVSRGAILSICVGTLLILILCLRFSFSWKQFFMSGFLALMIIVLGFFITPQTTQRALFHKVSKTVTTVGVLHNTKDETIVLNTPNQSSYYEPRLIIWSFFPGYAFRHPFGVGPNTHADFHVTDKGGTHVLLGPDNTYLQIWVWGGLLGIGSFLYLLGSAFWALFKKLKTDFSQKPLALFGILGALSVAIFFDASLSFYWFFIIIALAIRTHYVSTR